MNLLDAWVSTPLASALGWTLVHSMWQGAIVSGALGAVLLATRSPRIRYAAACVAALAILIAFGITLVHLCADVTKVSSTPPPASSIIHSASAFAGDDATPAKLFALVPWLSPIWIAGVWTCYIWQIASCIGARSLRHRGVCRASREWQERVAQFSARLRVSRRVLLLESCLVEAPAVLGHFRPVILMPIGLLAGLPPSQIEAILLHELAHIRRCDYLIHVFERLVAGLFFYHPAIWWIFRVVQAEREHCCDDIAVAISGDTHDYASALAALEQNRGPAHAIAASGGNLVNRIHRLLYPAQQAAPSPSFGAALLIATAAIAVAAWANPQDARPQHPSTDRYEKWLNEEVVYIIAPEERTAFERLTTDAERDRFIEQFWLRRDPTPGTPANEFQQEHYRRIAYANQRFATASGKPGWQTDRGRIYILYGPPDEIESHPNGRADVTYPVESWRYRYLESLGPNATFTFLDRERNRDYHLQPHN